LQDVDYVNRAGVDYAGFVFAVSCQQIDFETAKMLRDALDPSIKSVGVFVGESYEFIKSVVDEEIVDLVQFHGDFEYDLPCPTIRAFRLQKIEDIKPTKCDFVLFDSYAADALGSTGGMFDWQLIENYSGKPFFLAGGINITNIGRAMTLNPYCIDISSGVEENGKKSFRKIMEVVYACKQ
jgi:phosphoribosylanthranilate isomerase